jgi:hypothetical protein
MGLVIDLASAMHSMQNHWRIEKNLLKENGFFCVSSVVTLGTKADTAKKNLNVLFVIVKNM